MKNYLFIALFIFSSSTALFSKSDDDPYYEEYDFNGKKIVVKELENNKYMIKFPIDNIYMKKEGDLGGLGLSKSWVTDFDKDNNPEIILFWKEIGTGAYATLIIHELTNKGLLNREIPKRNKAVAKYYRGKDFFNVTDSEIIHEFPAYNDNDPNAAPTGGNVKIYYNYSNDNIIESGYKLIQPSKDIKNHQDKTLLKILQITGLKKYDRLSQSDTFVEIYISDKFIGKTKVVKNSSSPVFNETFTIDENEKSNFTFKIFDEDMKNHDFIGELNLLEIKSGNYPIMKQMKDGSIKKVAEIEIEYLVN